MKYLGEGRTEVWFAPLRSGSRRLIAGDADRPVLSPDGRWIVYSKCIAADYCGDLYVASTDGDERRLLARRAEAGAWTPDSRHVIAWRPDRAYRDALARIDTRAGGLTVLVRRPVEQFSVSPSGRELCFTLNRGGRLDLHVVGIDGGPVRR